jgi:hypothetical protein
MARSNGGDLVSSFSADSDDDTDAESPIEILGAAGAAIGAAAFSQDAPASSAVSRACACNQSTSVVFESTSESWSPIGDMARVGVLHAKVELLVARPSLAGGASTANALASFLAVDRMARRVLGDGTARAANGAEPNAAWSAVTLSCECCEND